MPSFAKSIIKSTQSNYLNKAKKTAPKTPEEMRKFIAKNFGGLPALPKAVAVNNIQMPVGATSPNFV